MRAALRVSGLNPNDVSLTPGESWSMRCPDCHRWRSIYRLKRVTSHRPDPDDRDGPECPGSRRDVVIDEHPAEWMVRLHQADAEVQVLRGKPPFMPQTESPEGAALAGC